MSSQVRCAPHACAASSADRWPWCRGFALIDAVDQRGEIQTEQLLTEQRGEFRLGRAVRRRGRYAQSDVTAAFAYARTASANVVASCGSARRQIARPLSWRSHHVFCHRASSRARADPETLSPSLQRTIAMITVGICRTLLSTFVWLGRRACRGLRCKHPDADPGAKTDAGHHAAAARDRDHRGALPSVCLAWEVQLEEAAARHVLSETEFRQEMTDVRLEKYCGRRG